MSANFLNAAQAQLQWLKNSGIQISDGADKGGVYAWIDEERGEPGFLYSEITGYFITLCVQLSRLQPDGGWLGRAESAAAWLLEHALDKSGAVLARKYNNPEAGKNDPYSFDNRTVLYFDAAMVGYGLVVLAAATQNRAWLDGAGKIGEFCLKAFASSDSNVGFAAFDLKKNEPLKAGPRWSQHFGSFEYKGAMFLHSLAAATGDSRYATWQQRALTMTQKAQKAEGRFPTSLAADATHLHPHNYTLEGLLYTVAHQDRDDLVPSIARGVDWIFQSCLKPQKLIHQWSSDLAYVFKDLRSDTLAQSLRSYAVTKLLKPELSWEWEKEIPELSRHFESFSLKNGGTRYGRDEYGEKPHANAWCHFFGLEMRLFLTQLRESTGFTRKNLVLT